MGSRNVDGTIISQKRETIRNIGRAFTFSDSDEETSTALTPPTGLEIVSSTNTNLWTSKGNAFVETRNSFDDTQLNKNLSRPTGLGAGVPFNAGEWVVSLASNVDSLSVMSRVDLSETTDPGVPGAGVRLWAEGDKALGVANKDGTAYITVRDEDGFIILGNGPDETGDGKLGLGTVNATALKAAGGSSVSPSVSVEADGLDRTGLFLPAAGELGFAAAGGHRFSVADSDLIARSDGAYTFASDTSPALGDVDTWLERGAAGRVDINASDGGGGDGTLSCAVQGGPDLSADPSDPGNGSYVMWQSDGTGSGDDGDIMLKITDSGGTTKTITLVDYSAA